MPKPKHDPAPSTEPSKPRDRHGHRRGLPPPPTFSLASLPDDTLLTEYEIAAFARVSTSTVASWRLRPNYPLRWHYLPGRRVRYTAGNLKAYLALGGGDPVRRGRPPLPKPTLPKPEPPAPPPRRRVRRAKADDLAVQEQA